MFCQVNLLAMPCQAVQEPSGAEEELAAVMVMVMVMVDHRGRNRSVIGRFVNIVRGGGAAGHSDRYRDPRLNSKPLGTWTIVPVEIPAVFCQLGQSKLPKRRSCSRQPKWRRRQSPQSLWSESHADTLTQYSAATAQKQQGTE
jgi:hypothetical protein